MSTVAYPSSSPATARVPTRSRFGRADAAFLGLLLFGAALVMIETRGLNFYADDWGFVLDRRGLSAAVLLKPWGPHLSLIPILIYKALLHLFGSSYLPFRVLAAFDLVLMAGVLGVVCRARWGRWWGLAPVLLLVTLGPGSSTLLWPFQVGFALSVAAGVLALIALLRGERPADVLACVLLIVGLASSSVGIGFLVGAAVIIALRAHRDARGWAAVLPRAWVVLIPLVLYGLWYLNYGHQYSETHLSLWKNALPYIAQALAATLAPLVGLSSLGTAPGRTDITFGVPLALAAIAVVAYAAWRGWRPSSLFWAGTVTLLVLWLAACLSNMEGTRPPNEPRYLPPDATLVMILLCDALPEPKLRRGGVVAACLGLAAIAATNAAQYEQWRVSDAGSDAISQAELGALNIMRGVVPPQFSPEQPSDPGSVAGVTAGPFFSAVDSFGPFGDSPAKIAAQSEDTRERADRVLAEGELGLLPSSAAVPLTRRAPTVLSGAARVQDGCVVLIGSRVVIRAMPGKYELTAAKKAPLTIGVARFATAYAFPLGTVQPGSTAIAAVRADRTLTVPWRMELSSAGTRVCSVAIS